jgi:DNA-binding LacI/PurR family transcriptional regulator
LTDTAAADRLVGYRSALEGRGIHFDEVLVRHAAFDERSGLDTMSSLLGLDPRPSAVFVASDEVALGALKAAKIAGAAVPDDVAIVGFDDLPFAPYVEPALTTIRVPAREIGVVAARSLVDAISHPNGRRRSSTVLDTELVVRDSSGSPRRMPG